MHRLLVLLLLSFPLLAQQPRYDNEVAVSYGRNDINDSSDVDVLGVSYNRYWTPILSTRLGMFSGSRDFPEFGSVETRVIHATAELHAFRGRLISPRIGGGLAHFDHRVDEPFFKQHDSKLVPAAIAALDVNITPRLAVGADALYLHYPSESTRYDPDLTSITLLGSARFRW